MPRATSPVRETVAIGNYLTHLDETKRGLAKLLARENILVRHANVPTAMFNVANRELLLPKFETISVDQYDLLIGHEVGHAKYSSEPEALELLKSCAAFPGLHTYVNVLEDTRIERLMKAEYPGLRGSFRRGYADFANYGPLFQITEPIATFSFIDRINIEYKVGAHYAVTFSNEERAILARVDALDSFRAVYQLAKELYDRDAQDMKAAQNEAGAIESTETPTDSTPESKSSDSTSESKSESKSESSESDSKSDSKSESESDSKSESKSESKSGSTSESAESTPSTPSSQSYPVSRTDMDNSDAIKTLASSDDTLQNGRYTDYTPIQCTLRPMTPTQVAPFLISSAVYQEHMALYFAAYPDVRTAAEEAFASFTALHGQTIKYMAREFELKKAARLNERAKTSKTGHLDVTKLYAYKFRDDLFKSVTITPHGQSHGIVVLIDASGSMSKVMSDTLEQALVFGSFAKSVGIPFKAVSFTTAHERNEYEPVESTMMPPTGLQVVTLLDSEAPNWKAQQIAVSAFSLKYQLEEMNRYSRTAAQHALAVACANVPYSGLSTTPLYGALLVVDTIVSTMKAARRLDKMTVLIVTDGEDSDGVLVRTPAGTRRCNERQPMVIRDASTRQVTACFDHLSSGDYRGQQGSILHALISSLQARHGARVVTIKLLADRDIRRRRGGAPGLEILESARQFAKPMTRTSPTYGSIEAFAKTAIEAREEMAKNGQVVFRANEIIGDAAILVLTSRLSLDVEDVTVTPKIDTRPQTASQIRAAFCKKNVAGSKNKVFVQTVMPFLA